MTHFHKDDLPEARILPDESYIETFDAPFKCECGKKHSVIVKSIISIPAIADGVCASNQIEQLVALGCIEQAINDMWETNEIMELITKLLCQGLSTPPQSATDEG